MSKLLGIRYIGDNVSGVRIEILGSRKQIVLSTECREYHFIGADSTGDSAKRYYSGLENAGIKMILDDNYKKSTIQAPNIVGDETPVAEENAEGDVEITDAETTDMENSSTDEESTTEVIEEDTSDESVDETSLASVNIDEISDDEVTEYLDTQVEDIDAFCTELGIKLKSRKRESQISELVKSYKNEVVVKMIENTKE